MSETDCQTIDHNTHSKYTHYTIISNLPAAIVYTYLRSVCTEVTRYFQSHMPQLKKQAVNEIMNEKSEYIRP